MLTEEQDKELNEQIGAIIRDTRERAGMKIKDLADRSGMSYQQMQKYEKGQNRIFATKLISIAWALSVDPSELLPEVF
jgi:transcriptional regulator with XRE-family HTH domain